MVHKLLAESLIVGDGQVELPVLREALASHSGFFVRGQQVTSRGAAVAEILAIAYVDDGVGATAPLAPAFIPAAHLHPEQQEALVTLLTSSDRVLGLSGPAGCGKSAILAELRRALTAVGRKVVACAPTAMAVRGLRANGFPRAMTLQRLLCDTKCQATLAGALIILDEAGMVSIEQMGRLFSIATQYGCRIVLSGDSEQHKSIEAGDALRVLEKESRLSLAVLHTVHRQTHDGYRRAVEALSCGHTQAALDSFGLLQWIKETDADRYSIFAQDFAAARESGKSAVVVSATWRECEIVSAHIRLHLKAKGLIDSGEHEIDVLRPLHLTEAHRRQIHHYEPGHVIVYRRNTKRFSRGEHLIVAETDGRYLQVRTGAGEIVRLDPGTAAKHFSVFSQGRIAVSVGDELHLLENGTSSNGRPITNGETAKIAAISPRGSIKLDDGRMIASSYRHFALGYATTSQRAQGRTVDHVLIVIDAQSAFCAATQETLYVAASRGRECCRIYTDDKERLAEAFKRTGDRLSAFEFFSDDVSDACSPKVVRPA